LLSPTAVLRWLETVSTLLAPLARRARRPKHDAACAPASLPQPPPSSLSLPVLLAALQRLLLELRPLQLLPAREAPSSLGVAPHATEAASVTPSPASSATAPSPSGGSPERMAIGFGDN
jgi:hypothetical protein